MDISLRFFLACLTEFSFLFALAAGRMRTAVVVLGVIAGLVIFGPGMLDLLVQVHPPLERLYLDQVVFDFLFDTPGPLGAFSGNWSFIDV